MKLALILGAAALVVGTAAAAAEDEAALEPSTPWGIDYGDDQCTLYRTFGEGDGAIDLRISQFHPGTSMKFGVFGKEIQTRLYQPLRVWLEPEESPYEDIGPAYGTRGDLKGVLFSRNLMRVEEYEQLMAGTRNGKDRKKLSELNEPVDATLRARANEITHLTIDRGFAKTARLHIGSMKRPMDAMNTCLDELMSHWGIDVEAHRTLSRRVTPKSYPGDWAKPDDYPDDLRIQTYTGIVQFRLMIDESGNPTDCIVQEATNPQDFAAVSCQIMMKRARFEPALDAKGKPIRSYWSNSFHWILPRR